MRMIRASGFEDQLPALGSPDNDMAEQICMPPTRRVQATLVPTVRCTLTAACVLLDQPLCRKKPSFKYKFWMGSDWDTAPQSKATVL